MMDLNAIKPRAERRCLLPTCQNTQQRRMLTWRKKPRRMNTKLEQTLAHFWWALPRWLRDYPHRVAGILPRLGLSHTDVSHTHGRVLEQRLSNLYEDGSYTTRLDRIPGQNGKVKAITQSHNHNAFQYYSAEHATQQIRCSNAFASAPLMDAGDVTPGDVQAHTHTHTHTRTHSCTYE
jgi:hypothetical protein